MSRKIPQDSHRDRCVCSFCITERDCSRAVSTIVYRVKRLDREFAISAKNNPDHYANCWVN